MDSNEMSVSSTSLPAEVDTEPTKKEFKLNAGAKEFTFNVNTPAFVPSFLPAVASGNISGKIVLDPTLHPANYYGPGVYPPIAGYDLNTGVGNKYYYNDYGEDYYDDEYVPNELEYSPDYMMSLRDLPECMICPTEIPEHLLASNYGKMQHKHVMQPTEKKAKKKKKKGGNVLQDEIFTSLHTDDIKKMLTQGSDGQNVINIDDDKPKKNLIDHRSPGKAAAKPSSRKTKKKSEKNNEYEENVTGISATIPTASSFGLKMSANRWKPSRPSDPVDIAAKAMRSILNKLSLENFDSLSEQALQISIPSCAVLKTIVDVIIDKASMEPAFATLYAKFCAKLAPRVPFFPSIHQTPSMSPMLSTMSTPQIVQNVKSGYSPFLSFQLSPAHTSIDSTTSTTMTMLSLSEHTQSTSTNGTTTSAFLTSIHPVVSSAMKMAPPALKPVRLENITSTPVNKPTKISISITPATPPLHSSMQPLPLLEVKIQSHVKAAIESQKKQRKYQESSRVTAGTITNSELNSLKSLSPAIAPVLGLPSTPIAATSSTLSTPSLGGISTSVPWVDTFRSLLLHKCFKQMVEEVEIVQFHRNSFKDSPGLNINLNKDSPILRPKENEKPVAQTMEPEEKETLAKLKHRGTIVLICELFKKNLLSVDMMRTCIDLLLDDMDGIIESEVEDICLLLNNVGSILEDNAIPEKDEEQGSRTHESRDSSKGGSGCVTPSSNVSRRSSLTLSPTTGREKTPTPRRSKRRAKIQAEKEKEKMSSEDTTPVKVETMDENATANGTKLVNRYFDKLKTLSNNGKFTSRIRFMILDLLELRDANWGVKIENKNVYKAKKIDRSHKKSHSPKYESSSASSTPDSGWSDVLSSNKGKKNKHVSRQRSMGTKAQHMFAVNSGVFGSLNQDDGDDQLTDSDRLKRKLEQIGSPK